MPLMKVIGSVVILTPHVIQAIIAIIRLLIRLKDKEQKTDYTKRLRHVIKTHIKSESEQEKPVVVELRDLRDEVKDAVEHQNADDPR